MKMNQYKILLVEDEIGSQELLEKYIKSRGEFLLADIAVDGREALRKLKKNNYDLVFLDINLPIISGLDVLKALKKCPYFIVITTRKDKAIEVYAQGGIDYLLKPIYMDRFNQAVDRYLTFVGNKKKNTEAIIEFNSNRKQIFLKLTDIIFIEANQRNSVIHSITKTFVSSKSLKDFTKLLPQKDFVRTHKSFLVNLNFIQELEFCGSGKYQITLNDPDDSILPVSRKYSMSLKKVLKK